MKTEIITPFFFEFESDFVESLRCIPMIVRYKLDTCGIKLKLPEWVKISVEEKTQLAYLPCCLNSEIDQYGDFVNKLVWKYTGHEAGLLASVDDSWNILNEVPEEVQTKAAEWNCHGLIQKQWVELDTLQRFALVKLSRSGHEGKNFPRAMQEFGLNH
ncbi:nitrate reductase associated protein [Dyadobacter sp. CY345]|uniref:nitrate reductase associated protein n=1 Tax=Dyadobacter sp. CY345 TaxID=2909335 RepID=UPI001F175FB5|nr:nitrate reductase associated protein [Dyadobacter sp. CY345]MCF2442781.1 nitrate reductase associated protein [Dyadobacter sp. CY345]